MFGRAFALLVLASASCVFRQTFSEPANLVPPGLERFEDVAPSDVDVEDLTPVVFHDDGEFYVRGTEMRRRAIYMECNLGISDWEHLLVEQDAIPTEFREFYIPLPGTVLRDSEGTLYIPYLEWHSGQWRIGFIWLDGGWYRRARFVCREQEESE